MEKSLILVGLVVGCFSLPTYAASGDSAALMAHKWCGYSKNSRERYRIQYLKDGIVSVDLYADGMLTQFPEKTFKGQWSLNESASTLTQRFKNKGTSPILFSANKMRFDLKDGEYVLACDDDSRLTAGAFPPPRY